MLRNSDLIKSTCIGTNRLTSADSVRIYLDLSELTSNNPTKNIVMFYHVYSQQHCQKMAGFHMKMRTQPCCSWLFDMASSCVLATARLPCQTSVA